ncbi:MAG: helix-turn-helix domain-containing protein, partial [Dehalococcoidia bacterium]|nr:helix-turn-helix domain-containing protein [Dehalococcoidia bacterium]
MSDTFGKRVRKLRLKNTEYSLREFARLLGVSASYLSDVENDRRTPPNEQRIIQMAELLKEDSNELLALAEKMPPDFYKT